jgi:hypothetical protein
VTENDQPSFSEEAALRELEDLQREIEQSRVRRKDANDAFDRFLRSFDRQAAPPPAPPPVAPPAPSEAPAIVEPPPTPSTPAAVVSVAPAAFEDLTPPPPEPDDTLIGAPVPPPFRSQPVTWPPSDLPPHPEDEMEPEAAQEHERTAPGLTNALQLDAWEHHAEPSVTTSAFPAESDIQAMTEATLPRETRAVPAALTAPAPRSSRRIPPAAGLLALLVVGAAVLIVWRARSRDTGAATGPAATATAVAQPRPQPAAATPVASPAPAAAAAPPAAEVSTVRKVWVRVMVDGQKVIARELPADARIPLTPTSQIVVRAGDAGAVRVSIAGKDQGPVGRDGEVATRAFTVTTPAVR